MKIEVIRKDPGYPPRVVEIENTLEALQEAVGGYIETVTFDTDTCVICDEEGRLKGYPRNVRLFGEDFVGTILVVGVDGEAFASIKRPDVILHYMGWWREETC